MIALDLDAAVVDGAARTAALLEFRRERFEFNRRQTQAADHRDALAFAALGLAADAHGAVTGSFTRCATFAYAFGHGPLGVAAALADPGRVDEEALESRFTSARVRGRDRSCTAR